MFRTIESQRVKYLVSDKITVPHAFSTRIGGVSVLPHTAELNLGFYRGDNRETVMKNLSLFSGASGIDLGHFVSVTQIHSRVVRYVNEDDRGAGIYYRADYECDGYVTDRPGVALCIKTADCVPILLADEDAGVIGAVHAGWKGTASGIVAECIRMMCVLGASAGRIKAAVGPAIGKCCYEVGSDVREEFERLCGKRFAKRFILPAEDRPGKYLADLAGANRAHLEDAGLDGANIDVSDMCTSCRSDLFYSHRKGGGQRGTMCSVIEIRGASD